MINSIAKQQDMPIYILDAETKQLITANFKYNRYENWKNPGIVYYNLICGGTMNWTIGGGVESDSDILTFNFEESQITELGYDYSSITGNIIKPSYVPDLEAYLFPSVAIISMYKLK